MSSVRADSHVFCRYMEGELYPHDGGEAKEKVGELYSGTGSDQVPCWSRRRLAGRKSDFNLETQQKSKSPKEWRKQKLCKSNWDYLGGYIRDIHSLDSYCPVLRSLQHPFSASFSSKVHFSSEVP